MKIQYLLSIFVGTFLLASGCATGTHIVTGKQRSPIKPEQVVIYQVPPAKFEVVGIVNAQSSGNRQFHMDAALAELKRQASLVGANGIILGGVNPGGEGVGVATGYGFGNGMSFSGTSVGVSAFGIQLTGQAIFVGQ
jgi:hypothetical protein